MNKADKEAIINKLRAAAQVVDEKKIDLLKRGLDTTDAYQYEKGKFDGLFEAISIVRAS